MTTMRESVVRGVGLGAALLYAALIVWIYARQPETFAQIRGGIAASVGAYRVDQQAFSEGLTLFHVDRFVEARAAFHRADPAERDPLTQFYIAYSYYRQGWGRVYNDDALFKQGLEVVDRAIALAPGGRLVVEDDNLGLKTADELRGELQRGLTRDASDLNPLRLFGTRK